MYTLRLQTYLPSFRLYRAFTLSLYDDIQFVETQEWQTVSRFFIRAQRCTTDARFRCTIVHSIIYIAFFAHSKVVGRIGVKEMKEIVLVSP